MVAEAHHCVAVVAVGPTAVMSVVAELVATDHSRTAVGPAVHRLCLELGYNVPRSNGTVLAPVASPGGFHRKALVLDFHRKAPVLDKNKPRDALVVAPGGRGMAAVAALTALIGPFAAAHVTFQVLGMRSSREAPREIVVPAGLDTAVTTALSTPVRGP